ncbi:MAG: hypothetical protein KatS3mg131_0735 [Candidatus Tectimicrobiota bacterium]|nr:MAG: hypothetical protein KatS3mg131_0735 [Candidatus Tectomicrobia bacterium]
MDVQAALQVLNKALALEYAGVLQYLQQSFLVQGPYREVHADFFRKLSDECRTHAARLGTYIVLLNGVPTVEPAPIRQSTDLTEMLKNSLELEREAYNTYLEGVRVAADEVPLRLLCEELAYDERLHMEAFEKMLAQKALRLADAEREIVLTRSA